MQISETRSGLIVAEDATDFRSVAAALREHDQDLRLVPQQSDVFGCVVYKVFRYAGSDRPAWFVCGWWNEHLEPLPLSHRLVDHVKGLDRNERGHQLLVDPDVHNEKLMRQKRRQAEEELDGIAADFARSAKRSPAFHRGQHLRRAKNRAGNQPL